MSNKYNIVQIIKKKRDKEGLSNEEIEYLIKEYTADRVPDYQMSAFLMASYLNGMSNLEASVFAKAMLNSGTVLDLSDITGLKVDKHSTGGVGDKISLILAPIVAACGVPVPMISGRGLGHSGGTLDKLESIPGFNVNLDLDRYREVLKKHKMVLIGQTEEIAPADKRMYALRDVTATVECVPLIAGSIMSKKLAEGIDALVLDVKCGNGAFMKTQEDAEILAQTLVSIGESFGKQTIAYLTDMNEPLGQKIGNWLEVEESIDSLQGNGPEDIMELTHVLAGTMIYLGKKAESIQVGIELSKKSVEDGSAWAKFRDIVIEQGGDVSFIDNPSTYPKAAFEFGVEAEKDGYISSMDTYLCGIAALELGAGRKKKEDTIDPIAGIIVHKKVGDRVYKGETIYTCRTKTTDMTNMVSNLLIKATTISMIGPNKSAIVSHKIDKNGIMLFS